MSKIKVCPECGVPRIFSKGNRWESNGCITAQAGEGKRAFFYEVGGFNGLFSNLERTMGTPIDRIVSEGNRKNSVDYLRWLFSGPKGVLARSILHNRVYKSVAGLGLVFGYGYFEILDVRRGESVTVYGRNIYCMPMFIGDILGVFSVMEKVPAQAEIEEKGDGHIITVSRVDKPEEELASRLQSETIRLKPGDIEYKGCSVCGLPAEFGNLAFDLKEGIITDTTTGRRMATTGMDQIVAVFRELEAELGEDVVRAILDAQRLYIRSALDREEIELGYPYLRRFLAFRGMGNMVRYDARGDALDAVVENASPPLLVAGMLQGIFELLSGSESDCEYRRNEDATLEVAVRAR
ncbi:MAG: hypothetical protein C4536_12315 [Actinobacteria bacterium]|nr:MAG: hypothetical protein C4536_12315 [Actinomycetota bacterium]